MNIMGNRENAGDLHFLFSSPVSNGNFLRIIKTWVYAFTTQSHVLTTLKEMAFENIVGASTFSHNVFEATFDLLSANALNMVQSKKLSFGKDLKLKQIIKLLDIT